MGPFGNGINGNRMNMFFSGCATIPRPLISMGQDGVVANKVCKNSCWEVGMAAMLKDSKLTSSNNSCSFRSAFVERDNVNGPLSLSLSPTNTREWISN